MSASRQLLSQGAKVPLWLKQRAGGILSQIVLRPGGVQATLEVYLAGIGGESATGAGTGASGDDAAGEEMKALLRVARLLAVPPKRVSSVEYVAHVAPQLTEMLHYDGQQRAVVTRYGWVGEPHVTLLGEFVSVVPRPPLWFCSSKLVCH